jgi:hypothetical protein
MPRETQPPPRSVQRACVTPATAPPAISHRDCPAHGPAEPGARAAQPDARHASYGADAKDPRRSCAQPRYQTLVAAYKTPPRHRGKATVREPRHAHACSNRVSPNAPPSATPWHHHSRPLPAIAVPFSHRGSPASLRLRRRLRHRTLVPTMPSVCSNATSRMVSPYEKPRRARAVSLLRCAVFAAESVWLPPRPSPPCLNPHRVQAITGVLRHALPQARRTESPPCP